MTLPAVEGNASRGLIGNSTFLSAGASKPTVANSSDANECSFGETYRTGKRGGQYIGLTADIPYSGLVVSVLFLYCLPSLPSIASPADPTLPPPPPSLLPPARLLRQSLTQLCLPPCSWVWVSSPSSSPLPLLPSAYHVSPLPSVACCCIWEIYVVQCFSTCLPIKLSASACRQQSSCLVSHQDSGLQSWLLSHNGYLRVQPEFAAEGFARRAIIGLVCMHLKQCIWAACDEHATCVCRSSMHLGLMDLWWLAQ